MNCWCGRVCLRHVCWLAWCLMPDATSSTTSTTTGAAHRCCSIGERPGAVHAHVVWLGQLDARGVCRGGCGAGLRRSRRAAADSGHQGEGMGGGGAGGDGMYWNDWKDVMRLGLAGWSGGELTTTRTCAAGAGARGGRQGREPSQWRPRRPALLRDAGGDHAVRLAGARGAGLRRQAAAVVVVVGGCCPYNCLRIRLV